MPDSVTPLDGVAVVYCDRAFSSAYGKTAHGLVRFTRRYRIAAVIDSELTGRDAGEVLDGTPNGIPLVADLAGALAAAEAGGSRASHFVVGLATDGGILPPAARRTVVEAIEAGLHVDSGLHEFLAEDADLAGRAFANGVRIRDVRMPPPRKELHFFSGKIEEVTCPVVALLGTDSAVGKRTTAWAITREVERRGGRAEMVGTGQTAWMQGARYSLLLDSLVNDFVAGEIEHAVHSAWKECNPDLIVVEGQGSLMHPAYPGGFEILGAARPGQVVVQHAPARRTYDGFDAFPLDPLETQIRAIELIGRAPVVAVTLNHESLSEAALAEARATITATTGLLTVDVLREGAGSLVDVLLAGGGST